MSRHIVCTFQSMLIFRAILRNKTIENGFHIYTDIRVCILIDAQSATCVLAEDVDDARLWQLGQLSHDFACYQVETSALWSQCYFCLLYHIIYF